MNKLEKPILFEQVKSDKKFVNEVFPSFYDDGNGEVSRLTTEVEDDERMKGRSIIEFHSEMNRMGPSII